jgi:nucleoside-triphosphatase THEP1
MVFGSDLMNGDQADLSARLAEFTRVYRNMSQFPLFTEQQVEQFFVPYGRRTLIRLQRDIEALEDNGKLIFTGHTGCGKSTLLGQLARNMRDRNWFVVGFSIAAMVEMSDVNHINILYAIAIQLLKQAIEAEIEIDESLKAKLTNWFTQTKTRIYSDQLKQEMSIGASFFDWVTGKLQKEQAFREEIKETYENQVSELSEQIDLIAATIQAQAKKPVLVIIDDLDKLALPVVRTIFRDNIATLFSPNVRVVFTIPIATVREPDVITILDSKSQRVMLGVTKFFHQSEAHDQAAEPIEDNVQMLIKVLEKRIPNELIEPEIKRQMVLLSGGVLRELVRLGGECCRECMFQLDLNPEKTDVKIDATILKEAVKNLRNQFARMLGTDGYDLLLEIYREFRPPNVKSSEFLELLHSLYVLEYENDDLWYDLHPLVMDLLRRQQLIQA